MLIQNKIDIVSKGKPPIHVAPSKNKDLCIELMKQLLNLFLLVFDGDDIFIHFPSYYHRISMDDAVRLIYSLMDNETRLLFRKPNILDCLERLQNFPELQVAVNAGCLESRYCINLNNGIYDVRTMHQIQNSKQFTFDYQYSLQYTSNCTLDDAPVTKAFLESSLGNENIECFRRMLAYCISSLTKGRKCFLLIGKGKTGKSTLLNLLEAMMPEGTVSHEPFHRMASEQSKAKYRNKRLNISRDNSSTPMKHEESFKSLISAEITSSRDLYERSVDFTPMLKFIFASNFDLSFAHPDDAIYDRIVPIIFSRTIPEKKRDLELETKLLKEKDVLFSWAMDSLGKLIKSNYDFCISAESEAYLIHRRMELHTVPDFLNEMTIVSSTDAVSSVKLFKTYEDWCIRNGLTAIGRNKFYGEVSGCLPEVKRTKIFSGQQQIQGFKGIRILPDKA